MCCSKVRFGEKPFRAGICVEKRMCFHRISAYPSTSSPALHSSTSSGSKPRRARTATALRTGRSATSRAALIRSLAQITERVLHGLARDSRLLETGADRCIPPTSLSEPRCTRMREPPVVDGPGSRQRLDGGGGVRRPDATTQQTLLQPLPGHVAPRHLASGCSERFRAPELGSKASEKRPIEQRTAQRDPFSRRPRRARPARDCRRPRARPSPA